MSAPEHPRDRRSSARPPGEVLARIVAPGESASAWIDAIARFDPARAIPLKLDADSAVWRAVIDGRDVVLKRRRLAGIVERLKAAFRASRAWRHWRGAEWLMANGFFTARPLALLAERRRDGDDAGFYEWLALEHLPGRTVLEHLRDGDLSVRHQHALARALATQVSEMIARGRFNRDHKPSNLIVTSWSGADASNGRAGQPRAAMNAAADDEPDDARDGSRAAEPSVAIIDCVAINRCRRYDFAKMKRMLSSLVIEPMGTGCLPRLALRMRALSSIDAAVWWRELEAMVLAHGDPRPRVDPLAGPAPSRPSRG